jgi:hypothetical protein
VDGFDLGELGFGFRDAPPALCATPYSFVLETRHGREPVGVRIASGSLPPGLSFDSQAQTIAGTPATVGTWPITIEAADVTGEVVTKEVEIEVLPGDELFIPRPLPRCFGQSIRLDAPPGFDSYLWQPGGEATASIDVAPDWPTTYGVLATDAAGCVRRGSVHVEVASGGPPGVLPPSPVAVAQTGCVGTAPVATGSKSPALGLFLSSGSATDPCDGQPTRLSPRVGGADAGESTAFPAGDTGVVFRYGDAAGNVGEATSVVTVQAYGDLDGNAAVDVFDVVILAGSIVGNVTAGSAPFLGPAFAADVDRDGDADLFDLVRLAAHVVGNVGCLAGGS